MSQTKREEIYAVAEPLFDRFGFKKTTVEEICREAGISKRTYYELFKDKADLLISMLLHMSAMAVAGWRESFQPGQRALERLDAYITGYENFGRAHPVFTHCMYESEVKEHTCGFMARDEMKEMLATIEGVIVEGIESGELRPMDPPTIVWIIDGLLDAMYYVYPDMTGEPGALENKTLSRELRAFILNGLRNPDYDIDRRDK